jgi:hypothetical protein
MNITVDFVEIIFQYCNILVGKPERKRPLGRPGHRWEDNIRLKLRGIWWGVVEWTHFSQDKDQW